MSSGIKLRKIYRAGYCIGRGAFADRSLGWKKVRFYARAFLLEHPTKGLILIDTGYGKSFVETTSRGIAKLYAHLLPVVYQPEDSLISQLSCDGIQTTDLSYVLLTHFHPDHVGALPEFNVTPWIYRKTPLEQLQKLSSWKALRKGFLPDLIPAIPKRSIAVEESDFGLGPLPFQSIDLFSDGSLYLVDLPGHALGQMGVFTSHHFFVADALWCEKGQPHPLGFWLQEDPRTYKKTYEALRKLDLPLISTHSIEAL